ASLVTSHLCAIAVPLALSMRAAVSPAATSSMSRHATLAPALAKANAMARPMPSAAPTTMAGLPSRRKGLSDIAPALVWPRSMLSRPPHHHLHPDRGRFTPLLLDQPARVDLLARKSLLLVLVILISTW